MSRAAADRNLLFGILALQMDFIGRAALIAAMSAWVLEKARPLGQILLAQGALAADDHEWLEVMVRRHLEKHGHDAERSLAAVAGPEGVRSELCRIADGDLNASLAQLPATPSLPADSLATTGSVASDGARFEILRRHASGGLGDVFVARDGDLNREVALKAIQARLADHPESRARFMREAEITGGLEHPNIVPVYALGQYPDGRPYYAMRLIRGDSLKRAIERYHTSPHQETERNLELRQLLSRFIAVCNAIAYAHSRGVLHRDLKPSNIMLGQFGEALVVDWGLAKRTASPQPPAAAAGPPAESVASPEPPAGGDGSTGPWLIAGSGSDGDLTRSGQALGTPAYMSPEQAAGRLDVLGPASDVYSLGATLYHLLTGRAPFPQEDVGSILRRVEKGDFPPPRRVNRRVPAALEAICLRAMALRPQDRYASAKALADDLEHWQADEAVTAHAEPWTARLGRWVRHHKLLVGGAAAVAAVGLTVAVAGWLVKEAKDREASEQQLRGVAEERRAEAEEQKGEADNQRAEAVTQRTNADTERKRADRYLYFSRINLADRARQDAEMTRVDALLELMQPQHTGGEDLRGFERDYLFRLRQNSLWAVNTPINSLWGAAHSPGGRHVAAGCAAGVVKVWGARTGQEALSLEGHVDNVRNVAFSPDSRRLASAGFDQRVKVWDVRTGQEALVLKGHTGRVHGVAFSPDGRRLASAGDDLTIKVWDALTGQELLSFKAHTGQIECVAYSPDGRRLASAGWDQTLRVWDARTGQELLTLKGHTNQVRGVAYSPDGTRIASAGHDRTVRVWDASTGRLSLTLRGHSSYLWGVAYSPDGQRLASASQDGTVKVWDARTGLERLTLRGHRPPVIGVAYSPDGRCLVTNGGGGVKLWDARTPQESLSFTGHTSTVKCVAYSPDGQRLASASDDHTVKVWDARTGRWRSPSRDTPSVSPAWRTARTASAWRPPVRTGR
jgi:WD40 repeat protein/serine/threonine protein kinase